MMMESRYPYCFLVSVFLITIAVLGDHEGRDIPKDTNVPGIMHDFPSSSDLTKFRENLEAAKNSLGNSTEEMQNLISKLSGFPDKEPIELMNRSRDNQKKLTPAIEHLDARAKKPRNHTDFFVEKAAKFATQLYLVMKNATEAASRSLEKLDINVSSRFDWEQIKNHSDALNNRHNLSLSIMGGCRTGMQADRKPLQLFCAFVEHQVGLQTLQIRVAFNIFELKLQHSLNKLIDSIEKEEANSNLSMEDALLNEDPLIISFDNFSVQFNNFHSQYVNAFYVLDKVGALYHQTISDQHNTTDQDQVNKYAKVFYEAKLEIFTNITNQYLESGEEQVIFGAVGLNFKLLACVIFFKIIAFTVCALRVCKRRKRPSYHSNAVSFSVADQQLGGALSTTERWNSDYRDLSSETY